MSLDGPIYRLLLLIAPKYARSKSRTVIVVVMRFLPALLIVQCENSGQIEEWFF